MTLPRLLLAIGSLGLGLAVLCSACSDPEAPSSGPPLEDAQATAPDAAPSSPDPTSDAGPSPPDAAPDGPFDYCTAQAARYASCFPTVPFERAQCQKQETCLRTVYHPDLDIEGYLRCTSASCSGGGLACLQHISAHSEDQAFEDFLAACKTRRDACGELGPKQFEDACSPFAVMGLLDDVLAERATCLAEGCTEIAECMGTKLRTRCGL